MELELECLEPFSRRVGSRHWVFLLESPWILTAFEKAILLTRDELRA